MATYTNQLALIFTLFTIVYTLPNNQFYHQEYKYKTSSSSYRNNELQQQNDDEGYMSKHGDLEGRTIPIVQSHSQRSEYINPKLRDGYITPNSNYNYNGDTSEGYMDVDSTMGVGAGLMNNYGYNRNSYSYGNLRSIAQQLQEDYARQLQHYQLGYNRDFSTLEQELRQNVTQRLQEALMNRYGQQSIRSGMSYSLNNGRISPQANYEHQELLDLQRQMENELISQLRRQYYSQSSYQNTNYQRYSTSTSTPRPYTSYTTHVPIYAPTTTTRIPVYPAPYSAYSSTAQRESITNIATRVQSDLDSRLNTLLDNLTRNRQYGDYTSLSNRLENELRTNITYLLDREIQRIYGNQIQRDGYMYSALPNGNYDTQYNYNIRDLENLKQQIEKNLLTKLNRDLGRYTTTTNSLNNHQNSYLQNRYTDYGTNNLGGNYYSSNIEGRGDVGHTSRPSAPHLIPLITGTKSHNSYNYQSTYGTSGISANTISELQSQLQNDMSRQLQAALNRNRYSYSSSYGPSRNYQVSFQELSDELNRNLTRQLNELQSRYSSGSGYSSHQFDDLRNQLQNNLMRELQQGLQHSYSSSSSYSASSSSSSSNYRPVRANNIVGSYPSGIDCDFGRHAVYKRSPIYYRQQYSSPYGSNQRFLQSQRSYYQTNDEDLTQQQEDAHFGNLQNGDQQQIEDLDLTQQQQQQQQHDFKPLSYLRSTERTTEQQENEFERLEIGSQQQIQDDFKPQSQQQVEEIDLTQQQEEPGFGKLQIGGQQQIEDLDLTQQQQEDDFKPLYFKTTERTNDLLQQQQENGFEKLQIGSQKLIDDSDLTQQQQEDDFKPLSLKTTERTTDLLPQQQENEFERLEIGSQQQIQDDFKPQSQQQVEEIDLTQQQEEPGFGKLQIGSQQQIEDLDLTQQQQEDDFKPLYFKTTERTNDLLQQQQENGFEKLQIGSQHRLEEPDLTQQQQQEVDFGRVPPQLSSHQFQEQVEDLNQHTGRYSGRVPAQINQNQVEESDLTQQQEEPGFEKLQIGSQQQLEDNFGQQLVENVNLTQQQEEPGFGKLEIGNSFKPSQQIETFDQKPSENLDLTQQQEENGFSKQQLEQKQVEDIDLTQQQEIDDGFGKFEVGNQRQTTTEEEFATTTQNTDEITGSTSFSTSTRRQPTRIDREFLTKIERENDMLLEMVRQRALENQRRGYQSQHYYQDSYNRHNYNYDESYQGRTYSSPYDGRSLYQAVPQEVDNVYHRAEVQKPMEIETANTVEILEPIEIDPHVPTRVKSEHLAENEPQESTETTTTATTEAPGFWKRLGNKISTGAKSLKEKIVG